ncbi:MAG TPA: hypothetical protein VFK40_07995 [Nitrososphaeraceae archaeon]|nr:hypothetical protein [Nitrososphaeraceae archaeon]
MCLVIVLILIQTTVYGTIPKDYFNPKEGINYNKNIGTDNPFQEREEYKENMASQGALCGDPQAIKKYGEVCRESGEYQEDVKDKCKVNDDEDGNDKCKIDGRNDNDEDSEEDEDKDEEN